MSKLYLFKGKSKKERKKEKERKPPSIRGNSHSRLNYKNPLLHTSPLATHICTNGQTRPNTWPDGFSPTATLKSVCPMRSLLSVSGTSFRTNTKTIWTCLESRRLVVAEKAWDSPHTHIDTLTVTHTAVAMVRCKEVPCWKEERSEGVAVETEDPVFALSLLFFHQSASQSVSVNMPTPSMGKLRWNELEHFL